MKKSILTIALAVMMLFAFVACEPSSMTIKQENETPSVAVMATLADPDYYAGSTELASGKTIVKATVTKEDGSTVSVMGTLTLDKVVAGENVATFAYGPTKSQTTVNAIVNGVGVTAIKLDTSKAVTEFTKTTIASATAGEDVVATLVFADGYERTAASGEVDYAFNGTASGKEDSTAVVATLKETTLTEDKDLKAEYEITVTDYEPAAPVVTVEWAIQVKGADGTYADGEDVSIKYNQSKSDIVSQIRVLETTTTDGEETTAVLKEGTDYVIQGIPSGKLTANGTYTVVPLVDLDGEQEITFTTQSGVYTVVDSIDWNSLKVEWAETPANLKVGGTLDGDDVKVTLTKLSGTAVSSSGAGAYSVSYIGIHSFPETDYKEDDSVTVRVKVTVGSESGSKTLNGTLGPKA